MSHPYPSTDDVIDRDFARVERADAAAEFMQRRINAITREIFVRDYMDPTGPKAAEVLADVGAEHGAQLLQALAGDVGALKRIYTHIARRHAEADAIEQMDRKGEL